MQGPGKRRIYRCPHILSVWQKSRRYLAYYYVKLTGRSATFLFRGRNYHYFYHRYNLTSENERAVEVPIVWDIVRSYRPQDVLEVGNVLPHYFPVNHVVVDKYEKGPNTINADIVDFRSSSKYRLIVAISTLEHVGWDEENRDPTKILRAIRNLIGLLMYDGEIVVTLPLGYNAVIDKLLDSGEIPFSEVYYLKRISRDNRWIQTDWQSVRGSSYGNPFPRANGLVIGVIRVRNRS